MSNQDFINSVKDGAIKAQRQYGICASMTIAQACLESGYGKYAPGNNMFGIKWISGCVYRSQSLLTTEYINGTSIKVYAAFRAYDSLSDSLLDHAQFLVENSRYANLLGVKDYKKACKLIQQDGYATAPNYANQLIAIIEENELYQYDMEDDIMDKIVLYFGDADLFAAVIVSQKERCPLMLYQHFKDEGLKATKVIQIGGPGATAAGSDRFQTFKAAANLI